jgi:acetamidase/formamidase
MPESGCDMLALALSRPMARKGSDHDQFPRIRPAERRGGTRLVIMTIGSARPLEDAMRIAYRDLVYWMENDYGFERYDAYMLLSQVGRAKLGNFVDPKYTIGAAVDKKYLAGT